MMRLLLGILFTTFGLSSALAQEKPVFTFEQVLPFNKTTRQPLVAIIRDDKGCDYIYTIQFYDVTSSATMTQRLDADGKPVCIKKQ